MKNHTVRARAATTGASASSLGLILRLWLALAILALSLRAALDGPEEPASDQFDVETARHNEAQRRLRMLGDTIQKDYSRRRLRSRARDIFVDPAELERWWHAYQKSGVEGLKPEWTEMGADTRQIVKERYSLLGIFAEQEFLDRDGIQQLAEINHWHFSSAWRWLRRYRTGGLWGLAPAKQTTRYPRERRKDKRPLALGASTDANLRETYRRFETIKPLTEKRHASREEVESRAQEIGESARMLRYRLAAYREQGLAGLIPEERSDKGQTHGISPRMERIIRGIRLSNRNATVKTVHRESCKRASETNEKAPSVWQVRTVIKKIPEPLLLLADGREREFRNKYRLTYRIRFEGVVWQIDQTPVDALAVDIRQRGYQTKSGDTRIYLTTVIECNSRRVLAARFGYEPANRFNVAAVLRDAILVGGRPDEIWTDHGEEFKSRHVADLLSEFKIYIEYTNRPELKGRIERVFRTFNEQLWREQPGYVGSNTTQRHPDKRVKLSIAQLEKRFWKYLNEEYHQQPHSELPEKEDAGDDGYVPIKMSPMEYWNEYCFAEHIDPRRLDVFLKDVRPHTVGKWGIKHHQRKYWHESLGEIIGEDVRVRAAPYYKGPDEIEVFHNGRWVCTAFAYDSPKGEKVTGHDVARAQGQQRRGYRGQITEGRRDLRKVDKQIADEERSQQPTQQSPQESSTSTPESTAAKDESAAPNQSLPPNQSDNPRPANRQGNQSKGSRKPNFLDRMGDD